VADVILVAAKAMHSTIKPEWEWDDPACGSIRAFYCAAAEAALVAAAGHSNDALEDAARALYARTSFRQHGQDDRPDQDTGSADTRWEDATEDERGRFRRHVETVVAALERKGLPD
jgi:hypothetical protein